jgi:transcriptional regulator with XRE-family HTH domain
MALRTMVVSLRKEAGLSQDQLANKLGWAQQSVSDLETGRRQLTLLEVPDLARALKVTPMKVFRRFLDHLEN